MHEFILKIENFPSAGLLRVIRWSLAVFLILSSAAILYSTARNFSSAEELADQSLENTALALSSTAEFALRQKGSKTNLDQVKEIFSDRVVAYALIADDKGKILFHTNPGIIGNILPTTEKGSPGIPQKTSGHRMMLGTGLPAYEFNYPIHLADGTTEWLSLVLHTTPADRIVSDARRMWWIGSIVLLSLWIFGLLFERILTHSLKLKMELDRKNQLAVIGQMTAVLTHEIRNALGSIKGYAQLADEKLGKGDPNKKALASVLEGTERIELLVHELLQFSRDESYNIKPVAVVPLLRDAIQSAVSGWNGAWTLNEIPSVLVNADEEKLHRVFINVIQNAVQAMGNDGTLAVAIHREGRWVHIKIEDSGPGISDAQKSLLFTPFHTTKTNGTGLGLAYSRKVIEGMKGKINLCNRDKTQGAVLMISIPKAGK